MNAIVDSHQHFWDPAVFPMPDLSPEQQVLNQAYLPEQLKPELAKAGVDHTVLVQGLPQTRENNRWLFSVAEKTDFVVGVVAWADLTRPQHLAETLDELQRHPLFCGVRHIVELEEDNWLVRKEVFASLKELARRKIPYDMVVMPRHLRHVLRIIREIPNLPVVIDHMGKPDIAGGKMGDWGKTITEIAQFPQVFCKVSGFTTQADWKNWQTADLEPFVSHALTVFGPERLMFGSDWPVCNMAGSYQKVWESINEIFVDLSEGDRQEIFGENAVGFYGLNTK